MPIVIPRRLEKMLRKDTSWLTNVNQLKLNVEGLFINSPEFFPDYTIHGLGHINEVLEHADALIAKKTLNKLTPRDTALLISAIVLHDLGMFLRLDGVRKLVKGDRRHDRIAEIGDDTWEKAWSDFVDRTKRYPEEKMRYLFGRNITVAETCVDKDDMTDDDKRIIGEFLRQHHPRMAHEIAVNGLPGSQDIDVFEHTGFTPKDRDMVGLLARSHGMAIRDTEAYIQKAFGRGAKPYNTPAFYLMAVLRIADYLDAGKHRAPVIREKQQEIPVPISVEEWTWNQRIDRSICCWDLNQKNRHIYAEPASSIEYVQLDKWLKCVQSELDLAWSILAEKYTDEPYRLSIHRVTCNIHEPGVRESMNNSFLTSEIKITANPEITKLMIAPLYGDNPTYGVRELIQNAVDACIEREHKEHQKGNMDYKGHVTVKVDTKAMTFTITDNGTGMNENVLKNYYLSAGASYRSSDEWKRDFTTGDGSRIARTGRFGVGFLAAFLLGDTISVTTQHMDDDIGYMFEFDAQSRPLNVKRTLCHDTGTTIVIGLTPTACTALEEDADDDKKNHSSRIEWYNWYAFDDPVVEYYIDGKQLYHQGVHLPRDPAKIQGWSQLDSATFESYLWKLSEESEFYCNGIRISRPSTYDMSYYGLIVDLPHISLKDPNAKLSVDLARSYVEDIPEAAKLVQELYPHLIARLLLTDWSAPEDYQQNILSGFVLQRDSPYQRIPFLLMPHGFILNQVSFLSSLMIDRYVILYHHGDTPDKALHAAYQFIPARTPVTIVSAADLHWDPNYALWNRRYHYTSPTLFTANFLSDSDEFFDDYAMQFSPCVHYTNVWMLSSTYQDSNPMISDNLPLPAAETHGDVYRWNRDSEGNPTTSEMPIDASKFDPEKFPLAIQIMIPKDDPEITKYADPASDYSLFSRILQDLLIPAPDHPNQDIWIPYDMKDRIEKFPTAFEKLTDWMIYILREERREEIPASIKTSKDLIAYLLSKQ